jgi:hypothetical protein
VSAAVRKLRTDDAALELLREIRDLLKDMLARERKREALPDLVEALRAAYVPGVSRFTAQGLLDLAQENPHGELSAALSAALDMDAPGRTIALGMLFAKLPQLEVVSRGRGVCVYRLRDLDA